MKLFITGLALCFIGIVNSQTITSDHKLHFAAGAVISGGSYAVVYAATKDKKKAFWYSLGASTLAGLAKEVYDSGQDKNRFNTSEWVATTLGGATVSTTISLFTGKNKKKRNAKLTAD